MSINKDSIQADGPIRVFAIIGEYVDFYARTLPDSEAVVCRSLRVSYRQLKDHVDTCARAMLALNVKKGDRVGVLCTPRMEFWILFLAASRIGATWVGLDPRYSPNETNYIVSDCQPVLLFSLGSFESREYSAEMVALQQAFPKIDRVIAIEGEMDEAMGFQEFLQQADNVSEEQYRARINTVEAGDAALIVYTSGTTGKPKGAMLSHHGLTCGATMQARHFGIERPILLVNFPINHVASVADTCATTLVKGGKIIFQERFDPLASLRAVEEEQCTMLAGVPTMLQMQLEIPAFETVDLSSLQLVVWGGAAMPRDGIEKLQKISPRLMQLYGMTETSANIVFGDDNASIDVLAESIGKPDSGVECRIVNDAGENCPVGGSGELQFKADFFFLGYWSRPEATLQAFTLDGWLKTGDIGFWRTDGNIELVGRKSEMFKSGGYNVYPREIEVILESLPEVAMAAVISVPDDLFQEVGHAFVLLERNRTVSIEDLRTACKENLANYKIPKQFSVKRSLPMLPVGKINKQLLRELAVATREINPNKRNWKGRIK